MTGDRCHGDRSHGHPVGACERVCVRVRRVYWLPLEWVPGAPLSGGSPVECVDRACMVCLLCGHDPRARHDGATALVRILC